MTDDRLNEIEQHLRWMSQQTAVAGHELEVGIGGALELVQELRRSAAQPPNPQAPHARAYWHRLRPHGAWELVRVTPNGVLFSVGGDALIRGNDTRDYMTLGEWHRLPDPPAPGPIVGDEET